MIQLKKIIGIVLLFVCVTGLVFAADTETEKPKRPLVPFLLNSAPGFGLGSFTMGDPLGGFICLGGEIVGMGLLGGGIVYAITAGFGAAMGTIFTLGLADPEIDTSPAEIMIASGLGVWACTKLFAMIRPFYFANRYNREAGLAEAVPGVSMRLVSSDEGYTPVPVLYMHIR